MKLLFDENPSPKLVALLYDLFPASVHVREVGLEAADDLTVWKYAQARR
jgi:predicted nuclease of predicted toxin-antitoxin system